MTNRQLLGSLSIRPRNALVGVELLPNGLSLQVQVAEQSRDDPAFHRGRNEWDGDDEIAVNLSRRPIGLKVERYIRLTMEPFPGQEPPMGGDGFVVEVDETYVGGKTNAKKGGRPGKPTSDGNKTPVLALLERGGDVRSFPIERATLKNIKPIMKKYIDRPRTW